MKPIDQFGARKTKLLQQVGRANGSLALKKDTSNLFRSREDVSFRLDVSDFNHVIGIDTEEGTVETEGMIRMEDLVRRTLADGFLPLVAPELKTITPGGAVAGVALESSSFRHGLFHQTVTEMEVLTPNGSAITVSPDENSDLFYALPNSYGTLGYILRLKIKLRPAKRYVKLSYLKFRDWKSFIRAFTELSLPDSPHDFIEGVIFSRENFVVMLGEMVGEAPYVSDYTFMKSFYKSISGRNGDYLTTFDYMFRWDPDWFWGSKESLMGIPVLRFALGHWMLHSSAYFRILRLQQKYRLQARFSLGRSKLKEKVVQDIVIPKAGWEAFMEFVLDEIPLLPIWLCGIQGSSKFPLVPLKDELYIDFGLWGSIEAKSDPSWWNRRIEKQTAELRGFKSLYSDVVYPEDEFWANTDRLAYESVKQKYDPGSRLKGLYQKVSTRTADHGRA